MLFFDTSVTECIKFFLSVVGTVRGLEKIWVIGDEFCHHTYQQYFKEETDADSSHKLTSFTFNNYEVCEFSLSYYLTNNKSPARRILNKFISAINEHNTLPKLVVFVLDDDLIRSLKGDTISYQIRK